MPVYEYHCNKCGEYGDYYVANDKKHPLRCQHCESPGNLERKAVQTFAVGSSTRDNTNYEMAIAMGGKRIGTKLTFTCTPWGTYAKKQAIVRMPNSSRN